MSHIDFKQAGMSIIELMVSVLIGLITVAGVTQVYLTTIMSSSDTLKNSKLNQELTTLMSVMANDIMRAGIWGSPNYDSPQSNPFAVVDNTALEVMNSMAGNTQVAANSNTGGSCIVYSYDADLDGVLDNADILGFRLNSGAVEMRQQGDTVANTRHDSCNDADDTWVAVTDTNLIEITALNFSLGSSQCINTREPDGIDNGGTGGTVDDAAEMNCYVTVPTGGSGDVTTETRQVDIVLTGRLVADNSVTRSINQSVRVRNDWVRVR